MKFYRQKQPPEVFYKNRIKNFAKFTCARVAFLINYKPEVNFLVNFEKLQIF